MVSVYITIYIMCHMLYIFCLDEVAEMPAEF